MKQSIEEHLSQEIVGKISFYNNSGDIAEVMEYVDEKAYLHALKKEYDYNLDGFKEETLSKNPELIKAVDDLKYGICGETNPHSLDWYISKK